jgi:hypothetical protein
VLPEGFALSALLQQFTKKARWMNCVLKHKNRSGYALRQHPCYTQHLAQSRL